MSLSAKGRYILKTDYGVFRLA